MKRPLLVALLAAACSTLPLFAAAAVPTTPTIAARPAAKPATTQSKTVGIDIVETKPNPDGSFTYTYQWKDKQQGLLERSVVVSNDTVVIIDGKFLKLADVTPEVLRKKSVATVGPDGKTAVMLRFGKALPAIQRDQLTPAQVAALESIAPKPTAASDAALDKRVADIVGSLSLNDPAKETRVKEILAADLRAVRDAHNAGFAPAPSVHKDLVSGLQAQLTPEQVDTVKDKLTAGKVPFTFSAYHAIVPNLSKEEDAHILDLLKQAREESLDVKNADEMTPIFERYKKQIEQYLTANGHDWKTLYRDYVAKQKAAKTAPAE